MENNEIGSRIKELMFRLELNQTAFAESIGVSQTAIVKIINKQSKPRFSLLEAICEKYPQVSKDWLMNGTGEIFKNSTIEKPSNSDGYLQEYLRKLEERFEKLLHQKDKVIESQQYLIEHLSGQLGKLSDVIGETQTLPLWSEIQARA
jgi:transcriptional regulator with XRE-family HTH domain